MANADEMMVKIKCHGINENFLCFYEDNISDELRRNGFSDRVINAYEDADSDYLGNVGLLFANPNNEDNFIDTFNEAWHSFVDLVEYENNELTIYFRSADGGSKQYFDALYNNYADKIEKICITLSDDLYGEDLEWLQDEYGEDFAIEIE